MINSSLFNTGVQNISASASFYTHFEVFYMAAINALSFLYITNTTSFCLNFVTDMHIVGCY